MSDERPAVSAWSLNSRKITDFLLKADHPDNKGRDKFFRDFGFTPNSPEILARALIQQPRGAYRFKRQTGRVSEVRLVSDGSIETPDGRGAQVRTVWSYDDAPTARFLTVIPLDRRESTV